MSNYDAGYWYYWFD